MKFVDSMDNDYVPSHWLTFNDVLLKPQRSKFKSRNDSKISLSSSLTKKPWNEVPLSIPIISANMDTITGIEMASAMYSLGGLGILHRFYSSKEEYLKVIQEVAGKHGRVAFSVGCGQEWLDFTKKVTSLHSQQHNLKMIVCLDVAHGHMEQSIESVEELSKLPLAVIAGNVATGNGAVDLADAGADIIKIGVGSGSVCSTRIVTGHGVPQLSAIMSVKKALKNIGYDHIGLIADGGIRNSGDIVKALAAGADAVMLGNMLSGCTETPGEFKTVSENGQDKRRKLYRGQSSRHFLDDKGKIGVASEGEHIEVASKGSVRDVVGNLIGGIRSGLTYSGASDIYDLQEKAIFMEISDHSWVESTPHALNNA